MNAPMEETLTTRTLAPGSFDVLTRSGMSGLTSAKCPTWFQNCTSTPFLISYGHAMIPVRASVFSASAGEDGRAAKSAATHRRCRR